MIHIFLIYFVKNCGLPGNFKMFFLAVSCMRTQVILKDGLINNVLERHDCPKVFQYDGYCRWKCEKMWLTSENSFLPQK